MDANEIKHFIEAALLAAGRPLTLDQLQKLFDGRMAPEKAEIRQAIAALTEEYEPRGITIAEVASGFRVQVKAAMADQLQKLWEERPPRYPRALFETLASQTGSQELSPLRSWPRVSASSPRTPEGFTSNLNPVRLSL